MKEKTRQANFELLRILAMLMVITMHYLSKGNVIVSMAKDGSALNLTAWLIEAFCIVAVNVYVLISGYFLVEVQWKLSKVLWLTAQIWFYSIGVPIVCFILNIGEVRTWGLYDWLNVILPLQNEHYWFATAYVIFYLFSPVLAIGIKHISKKQLEGIIFFLLVVFSGFKSIFPVLLATDRYGNEFGWFMCLFLIAGYIRFYGIPFLNTAKKSYMLYSMFVFVIWGTSVILGIISRKGLPFSYAMDMLYSYNHVLVLLASVALFQAFRYIQIPTGIWSNMICRIAPFTFGVYLLHENIAVRQLWQSWFGVEKVKDSFAVFPHLLITVLTVFTIGVCVDFVRNYLFQKIAKIRIRKKQ